MSGKIYTVTNHEYEYTFEASENQLVIQIHRSKKFLNEAAEAKKHLSIAAFWLYDELIQHETNRVWALSPKQLRAINPTFTEHIYKRAKEELKLLGYLVQEVVDIGSYQFTDERSYHFYATPPNQQQEEKVTPPEPPVSTYTPISAAIPNAFEDPKKARARLYRQRQMQQI